MAEAARPREPSADVAEKAVYAGLFAMLLASYLITVAAPNSIGGGAAQFAVAVVALLLVGVGRRVRRARTGDQRHGPASSPPGAQERRADGR